MQKEGSVWENGGGWGVVILASYEFNFIREHENLVKDFWGNMFGL